MIRKIAVSMLLLIRLVSCAAPETETSPKVPVLESPQPTPFPERADIGDGGLLSGLPCAAPCVYGIQIGETPLDQVTVLYTPAINLQDQPCNPPKAAHQSESKREARGPLSDESAAVVDSGDGTCKRCVAKGEGSIASTPEEP